MNVNLSNSTVAVVGLGLMGGSLALALAGKCARLVGVASGPEAARAAVARRVVHDATCDLAGAVCGADVVVLATPVRHIISVIPEVAAHMRPGALLMDVGSTKGAVVRAMEALPEGPVTVGGHPMCGKETGGLDSADPALFEGAAFVLVPTARTTPGALALASTLVEAVGARPVVMDAHSHDRAVAVVSHLPYVLACALVHAQMHAAGEDRAADLLPAGGFRDTTRLAASEVDMMLDILLTNRPAIEQALDLFTAQLAQVRALLGEPEPEPDGLLAWMERAQTRRRGMFR